MTEVTQKTLEDAGCREFLWNGGAIVEWWKSISGSIYSPFDRRVCVRFGEYKNKPRRAYVITEHSMILAPGAQTVEDLDELRRLLSPAVGGS